jgi:hypothetical protein
MPHICVTPQQFSRAVHDNPTCIAPVPLFPRPTSTIEDLYFPSLKVTYLLSDEEDVEETFLDIPKYLTVNESLKAPISA